MSLPSDRLSTAPVFGTFLDPDRRVDSDMVDWERGGVAINDASQGLMSYNWRAWSDGMDIRVAREDDEVGVTVTSPGEVIQLSFAFDQNMRPAVTYTHPNGDVSLYYYDTVMSAYTTTLIDGASYPRLGLDDKRQALLGGSDVILAYLKGRDLYYRQQRDRYLIERLLKEDAASKLINMGMTTVSRLQFSYAP